MTSSKSELSLWGSENPSAILFEDTVSVHLIKEVELQYLLLIDLRNVDGGTMS